MNLFGFIPDFHGSSKVKYIRMTPFAHTPVRSTVGSAGYDMAVCMEVDPELQKSPYANMNLNNIKIMDGSALLQKMVILNAWAVLF